MTPSSTLLRGEASRVLETLPDASVHAVVTSPPYWSLRDYEGDAEQLGREPDPDQFVARLVSILSEAKRVLRRDGTLWLNLGDTYREKQLVGVPWRVAFALQRDGWLLRSECIWEKPNVTPESCRDRPTRSHEHLFLFAQRGRYFYDREAVRLPNTAEPNGGRRAAAFAARNKGDCVRFGVGGKHAKNDGVRGGFVAWNPRGKNRRSVWRICTQAFHPKTVGVTDVDHFAVMPPDLARPCVLASTPAGGVCPECGQPYRRVLVRRDDPSADTWEPDCRCGPPAGPVPATVLDPFCGSGTTGAVAVSTGRSFVGIDLSEPYLRLAAARIEHARRSSSPPQPDKEPPP